jgi:hypothetical protein
MEPTMPKTGKKLPRRTTGKRAALQKAFRTPWRGPAPEPRPSAGPVLITPSGHRIEGANADEIARLIAALE